MVSRSGWMQIVQGRAIGGLQGERGDREGRSACLDAGSEAEFDWKRGRVDFEASLFPFFRMPHTPTVPVMSHTPPMVEPFPFCRLLLFFYIDADVSGTMLGRWEPPCGWLLWSGWAIALELCAADADGIDENGILRLVQPQAHGAGHEHQPRGGHRGATSSAGGADRFSYRSQEPGVR